MAELLPDGSVKLKDGRIIWADTPLTLVDFMELNCDPIFNCGVSIPSRGSSGGGFIASGGGGGGGTGSRGFQGPSGEAGGAQGPQGWEGFQGPIGEEGVQGSQGIQGPQGRQGAQGILGLQGFQGLSGGSSDDWELAYYRLVDRLSPNDPTYVASGVVYDRQYEYVVGIVPAFPEVAVTDFVFGGVRITTTRGTTAFRVSPDGGTTKWETTNGEWVEGFGGPFTTLYPQGTGDLLTSAASKIGINGDANDIFTGAANEIGTQFLDSGEPTDTLFVIGRRRVF